MFVLYQDYHKSMVNFLDKLVQEELVRVSGSGASLRGAYLTILAKNQIVLSKVKYDGD